MSQGFPAFARAVGALPPPPPPQPPADGAEENNRIGAIGLPEVHARLQNQLNYWIEHDGAEQTASAPGPKAAERARRYIQHLLDRGGEAAPRCPIVGRYETIKFQSLRDDTHPDSHLWSHIPLDQRDKLSSEEMALIGSLAPATRDELVSYVPALKRVTPNELDQVLSLVR